jgi:hypothetical protein
MCVETDRWAQYESQCSQLHLTGQLHKEFCHLFILFFVYLIIP